MINPVSTVNQSQPGAQTNGVSQKPSPSKAPASTATPTDTVHLSNIAQAALQESVETVAQTTKEANGGDLQAKRLLAKEAAQQAIKK